ncbi:MAG: mobilization protein [Parafilimonas sp.]
MENEAAEHIKSVTKKQKGGRPKKQVKQDEFIGIKCSLSEKEILKQKAETAGLRLSEFLRESALRGQAVRQIKTIPKEVLLFTATLNHLAANLNQVAKKRNSNDELNAIERADLQVLSIRIKQLANDIKNYFR